MMRPYGFLKVHPIGSIVLLALALIVVGAAAFAATKRISPIAWGWFGQVNAPGGTALDGYDPVAYHLSSRPLKGNARYAVDWNGAKWLFVSAENKALFEASPEKFAPEFGGFCAYAVSKGLTAKIEPDAWRIEHGRLYLFNDQSIRDAWVGELSQDVIGRGEKAWATRRP
jgi:YHS domain-containing protein